MTRSSCGVGLFGDVLVAAFPAKTANPRAKDRSLRVASCRAQLVSELVSIRLVSRTYVRILNSEWPIWRSKGAEGGTRTPTPLRAHGPKPCVSAVSPLPRRHDCAQRSLWSASGNWDTESASVRGGNRDAAR